MLLGNKSVLSGVHTSLLNFEEETNLELFKALKEVHKYVSNMNLENLVLEHFLKENDPKLLFTLNETQAVRKQPRIRFLTDNVSKEGLLGEKSYSQILGATSSLRKIGSYSQRTRKTIKKQNVEPVLNYKIKIELAEQLCRDIRKTCESLETKATINLTRIKAELTELRLRNKEAIRTADSFRNYIANLTSSLVSKVSSEKFLQYIEEWVKAGMLLLNKLRTRHVSIKQQCVQQNNELNKKSKLRKYVRPVDYDYLRVQKEQFERSIEKTRQDLILVKLSSEQTVERLSKKSKEVLKVDGTFKTVMENIKLNQESIGKMHIRTDLVKKEIIKHKNDLEKIEYLLGNYDAPKIEDYLRVKELVSRLTKECKKKKLL